jgi:hypothetical protein
MKRILALFLVLGCSAEGLSINSPRSPVDSAPVGDQPTEVDGPPPDQPAPVPLPVVPRPLPACPVLDDVHYSATICGDSMCAVVVDVRTGDNVDLCQWYSWAVVPSCDQCATVYQ